MSVKTDTLRLLADGPKNVKQLKTALGANAKKLGKVLKELVAERRVNAKKGLYSLADGFGEPLEGELVKLGRSFGFVRPDDGEGDIFVPGHSLAGAMPGDRVVLTLSPYPRRAGSREGEILAVTTPCDTVAGTVDEEDGRLVLRPDNAPHTALQIKKSADGGVRRGEKAAGQILERADRHEDIRIGIIQRFGSADSARHCAKAILFSAGVNKSFPDAVKAEAKAAAAEKLTKEVLRGREDLRGEPIFTIDADSTKDIDDAVSVARSPEGGYLLGVHIADVSHYVRGGTQVDAEAMARGTSIYYADSVVPMLPRSLSNGACSLNPGEDRLAFSCLMQLDEDGVMLDYSFKKSVIRSRVKGVYTELNTIFEGGKDRALQKKYAEVAESLPVMHELYRKLAALRDARGSMNIESEEAKLTIDAGGHCVGVEKRTRGDAERLIEEFMLLANTAAAHLARRRELPFVYRVHDKPSADKAAGLAAVLTATGVEHHFEGDIPTQQELSALLDATRGTPLEVPVHQAILRSLAKAKYEPQPKGHYGLALADYAHFTSPIRRYPDLAIHRILSDVVAGTGAEQLEKRYRQFANVAAARSTEQEQLAVQIERDCDDCYKAEYMSRFVGEVFDGVIVSVMSFGVYVALPNTVEGLVPAGQLSEHRLELLEGVCLTDPVSGASYRIGQPVRVRVAGVDVSQGNVDFVPA